MSGLYNMKCYLSIQSTRLPIWSHSSFLAQMLNVGLTSHWRGQCAAGSVNVCVEQSCRASGLLPIGLHVSMNITMQSQESEAFLLWQSHYLSHYSYFLLPAWWRPFLGRERESSLTEAHQIDLSEALPVPTFERHSGLSECFDSSVAKASATAAVLKATVEELLSCSVSGHRRQNQEQNKPTSQCFVRSHPSRPLWFDFPKSSSIIQRSLKKGVFLLRRKK